MHGRSPAQVYLWIDNDNVEIRDAAHLWGKSSWETQDLIAEEVSDPNVAVICIGQSGENLIRFSKVVSDKTSVGGKGGMGAVMGSKNLKAVAVRGSKPVNIARPDEFYQAVKKATANVVNAPYSQMIAETGTLYISRAEATKRSAPIRNNQGWDSLGEDFKGWENLTHEFFKENYAVRHMACFSCPVACKYCYEIDDGPYVTRGSANEYGTLYPFTYRCGSDNMASSLLLTTMCDQFGLDTHSCGATISFAMEAWQRGLLTAEDTDGLDLSWGNDDSIIELVRKIAHREGFGNVLADGSKIASKSIKDSEICLCETKGFECSSYFPGEGETKVIPLGFATAPIGGSLHRGGYLCLQNHPRVVEALGKEKASRLGYADGDPTVYEGTPVLLVVENDVIAVVDSLETCTLLYTEGSMDEHILAQLFTSATGVEMDGDTLLKAGDRIFTVEKMFNVREGLRRKDDTLPRRFFTEKTTPHGIIGVNEAKFETMLDEYYQLRGWDNEGIPTEEKLQELNMSYAVECIPEHSG